MGRVSKKDNPNTETVLQDMELDVTPQEEIKTEIPLPKAETEIKSSYAEKAVPSYSKEPANCLRNERIIIRFVPSPTAMVQRKGQVL